jgi:uncharacterized membrane protein YeaQ/YmgE (transglycosylase-associated protein family)
MNNNLPIISNKNVAYNGAIVAIAAVFAYALVIMIYVEIRSSSTIYSIMPQGERASILWANGISVAYSIAVFSILMALISAIIGAFTAVVLKRILLYFNPEFDFNKAILISFIIALIGAIIIYFMLFALLKDWMTFSYIEPFLFWFLLPSAIYLMVCMIGGRQLNRVLKINEIQ